MCYSSNGCAHNRITHQLVKVSSSSSLMFASKLAETTPEWMPELKNLLKSILQPPDVTEPLEVWRSIPMRCLHQSAVRLLVTWIILVTQMYTEIACAQDLAVLILGVYSWGIQSPKVGKSQTRVGARQHQTWPKTNLKKLQKLRIGSIDLCGALNSTDFFSHVSRPEFAYFHQLATFIT